MDLTTYPPSPWDLHGHALAAVFLLPRSTIGDPPPGTHVVTVGGRAVVTTAFFRYAEPSPLQYDEVMATVLVRQGLRLRVWITHIWVDSPASRDGGRALWAIPKDLAAFDVDPEDTYVARGIASATTGAVRTIVPRLPLAFRIAQERDGRALVTRVRGSIRPGLARSRWRFTGPLAHLGERRPLLTLVARRFHLVFGSR